MPMSLHLHINITKEKIMKRVRSMTRMVAAMLYIAFAMLSVQTPAQAAMVGTGEVVAAQQGAFARAQLPAALATVLAWSGSAVTSESLVNEVYVPARKGSLQPELLAAARRLARAPYVLRSDVADVLREVAAGHPVLVLQNLGLSWAPRWHYAVVVGFDLARERVVLRSGTEKRHEVSLALFERTWRRAHAWAVVVPPPAELPATA